jgi:RNA exonuclease 1
MVFTTTNLFKGIACPEGNNCKLTNCIYTHPVALVTTAPRAATSSNEAHATEPASKRRRVTYESLADKPPSRAEKIKADLEAIKSGKGVPHGMPPSALPKTTSSETGRGHLPTSLSKPVSPPFAGGLKPTPKQTNTMTAPTNVKSGSTEPKKSAPVKQESLNPRMLPNAPESHAKRTIFIQHLHKDMVRLNNELKSSTEPIQDFPPEKLKVIALSDQEVIKLALDEEEKAARDQPKVYANVIKNRISAYRKMKVEAFIEIVKASFTKDVAKPPAKKQGKTISTGLTPAEEVKVAQRLTVPDQSKLAAHGYVPVPPTEAEAQEAARAVASSMNYEECDRCSARFRVFPTATRKVGSPRTVRVDTIQTRKCSPRGKRRTITQVVASRSTPVAWSKLDLKAAQHWKTTCSRPAAQRDLQRYCHSSQPHQTTHHQRTAKAEPSAQWASTAKWATQLSASSSSA